MDHNRDLNCISDLLRDLGVAFFEDKKKKKQTKQNK